MGFISGVQEIQLVVAALNGAAFYGFGNLAGMLIAPDYQMYLALGAGAYGAYQGYQGQNPSANMMSAGFAALGYSMPMPMLGPYGSAAAYGAAAYFGIPYLQNNLMQWVM